MWVWREDPASPVSGWRLDEYGTWTWDEHAPLQRAGVRADGDAGFPRPALALLPSPAEGVVIAEETPIFHAVSDDHSRRAGMRHIEGEASWAAIPEPNPGSGPLPIQHWSDDPRGLAAVPTVPPPPGPRDEDPETPQDELRRRAERRRRPLASVPSSRSTTESGSGRHALRSEEPASGRHALGG